MGEGATTRGGGGGRLGDPHIMLFRLFSFLVPCNSLFSLFYDHYWPFCIISFYRLKLLFYCFFRQVSAVVARGWDTAVALSGYNTVSAKKIHFMDCHEILFRH